MRLGVLLVLTSLILGGCRFPKQQSKNEPAEEIPAYEGPIVTSLDVDEGTLEAYGIFHLDNMTPKTTGINGQKYTGEPLGRKKLEWLQDYVGRHEGYRDETGANHVAVLFKATGDLADAHPPIFTREEGRIGCFWMPLPINEPEKPNEGFALVIREDLLSGHPMTIWFPHGDEEKLAEGEIGWGQTVEIPDVGALQVDDHPNRFDNLFIYFSRNSPDGSLNSKKVDLRLFDEAGDRMDVGMSALSLDYDRVEGGFVWFIKTVPPARFELWTKPMISYEISGFTSSG